MVVGPSYCLDILGYAVSVKTKGNYSREFGRKLGDWIPIQNIEINGIAIVRSPALYDLTNQEPEALLAFKSIESLQRS